MKIKVWILCLLVLLVFPALAWAHGGQGTTDTRLNLFEDPKKGSSLKEGTMIGKLTMSHNVVSALFLSLGVKGIPDNAPELLEFTKRNGQKILDLLQKSENYVILNDTKVCIKDSFVIDNITPEEFEGSGLQISFVADCGGPIGILKVKNGLFYDLGQEHYNFINVAGRGDTLIEGGMLTAQSHETEILVGTPSAKPETFGEFKKKVVDQPAADGLGKSFGLGIGALIVGASLGGFVGFKIGKSRE